jgi:exonuclease III
MAWNTNGKWSEPQTRLHINALMRQLSIDILCFSEPRIISEDIPAIIRSFGDKPLFISCEDTRVHGAGILLHEKFNGCVIRWEASRVPGRAVMGLIRTFSRLTMVINVYLPSCPLDGDSEALCQEIELDIANWIDLANSQHYNIIIAGDFNVNLHDTTKARANRLKTLFQNLFICLDGSVPTHDREGALDNIVISIMGIQDVQSSIATQILPLNSDHRPVMARYTINDKTIGDTITYYEYEKADLNRICSMARQRILVTSPATPPSLQNIHNELKKAVQTLKPLSKKGLHRTKAWINQSVADLYRRITELEHSRLKLKKNVSTSILGKCNNLVKTECKRTSTKFSDQSLIALCLSANSTATILHRQITSEIWKMQTSTEEKVITKSINIAKKNWNAIKPRFRTTLINRLMINGMLISDPDSILEHVTSEFDKRYNCTVQPLQKIFSAVKDLLHSTSLDWDQETLNEFFSTVTAWEVKVAAEEGADTVDFDEIMSDLIRNLDGEMLKWIVKAFTRVILSEKEVPI